MTVHGHVDNSWICLVFSVYLTRIQDEYKMYPRKFMRPVVWSGYRALRMCDGFFPSAFLSVLRVLGGSWFEVSPGLK